MSPFAIVWLALVSCRLPWAVPAISIFFPRWWGPFFLVSSDFVCLHCTLCLSIHVIPKSRWNLCAASSSFFCGIVRGHSSALYSIVDMTSDSYSLTLTFRLVCLFLHTSCSLPNTLLALWTRFMNVTVIQVYAFTETAWEKEKDDFYEELSRVIDAASSYDLKIVMGDFSAQIGSNNVWNEDVIGTQAMGNRNDNGDKLISFCSASGLKIGGSLFQHKQIHKGTWRSPDGNTVNQIDHMCLSRRWISSLQDVWAYRGADVASDHYMIVANLRIKLKTICRQQGENRLLSYNVAYLKDEKVQNRIRLGSEE